MFGNAKLQSTISCMPDATCRFAGGADSLLDLACGRGGDIWKWADAQVDTIRLSAFTI